MEFDERRMILSSATHGVLHLGSRVRVRVEAVDVDAGDIDFGFLGRISEEGEFTQRSDVTEDNQPLYLGNFDKAQRAKRGSARGRKPQKEGGSAGAKKEGQGRKPPFGGGKSKPKSKRFGSRKKGK